MVKVSRLMAIIYHLDMMYEMEKERARTATLL